MALPWYYSVSMRGWLLIDGILYYTDGLIAGEFDGKKTIKKGDYVLVEDDNVLLKQNGKKRDNRLQQTGYSDKPW